METQKLHRGRLIDHIQLVTKDLAQSKRFYAAVFEVLGIPIGGEGPGFFWADELFVSTKESPAAAGTLTGRMHFALQAKDKQTVERFHAVGLAAGGKDNGKPGAREYHPGYYAAFLLDPDGNNVEAVFHGPAKRRSASSIEIEILSSRSSSVLPPVVPPSRLRLLFDPWAWPVWIRWKSARIREEHAEIHYARLARHVPEGARVLDIGTHDGRFAALLCARRGCDVLALDVEDARQVSVPFRLIEGANLPVDLARDAPFDLVHLGYVLHHAADDLALLREARRVLADGGRVLVCEDQVETFAERAVTVGFHLWLLVFTAMGWQGEFRRIEAWRARFLSAGLALEEVVPLGSQGGSRLWPRNVLMVLRAG